MTIREQLEKETDHEEVKELEEENADNRRQCGVSVFDGYAAVVVS